MTRSVARATRVCLTLVLVAGCMATPAPPPSSTPGRTAAPSAGPTIRDSPSPTASAAPAAKLRPIAGVWRVRKVLAPADRSALIPGKAFEDEAFFVTTGCDTEPCPTIEVRITPLGRASPASEAELRRDGDRYISAARAENEGPCLDPDGDRVQGGATVTSTLQLWAADVRAAGSAVESTQLMGTLALQLAPTSIGSAAGCEPQTASYELTGRRLAVAVRNDEPDPVLVPDEPPNTAGGLATLPELSVKVSGAKITYFPIEGDTLIELDASLANGGVRACGAINYEWHEGDDRPAACAVTGFNDLRDAIDQRIDEASRDCTVSDANVEAHYTIHFPRWTAPRRVPARLLDWWRDVVVFIRDHEAGHVRISRDLVKKINARLLGAECRAVISIVRTWTKELNAAHEEYDRIEYAKPWPVPPAGY